MVADKKTKTQERLEAIFRAVDNLKSDLSLTTTSVEISPLHDQLKLDGKITYILNKGKRQLERLRRAPAREREVMLNDVTEFYAIFFPEANSVLYRIEVDGKEQIRGYIFLLNLKKEEK